MDKESYVSIKNTSLGRGSIAVAFGLVSLGLGYIQFKIPGMEGAASDFREIPLLISLFYIKHPIGLLIESLITSLGTQADGSYVSAFNMHFFPLWLGLWFYSKISKHPYSHYLNGFLWFLFTLVYYSVGLIPIMIITDFFVGINTQLKLWEYYGNIIEMAKFEMINSALVSSIFLVQLDMRRSLIEHKQSLVSMVNKKTRALAEANDELKNMNENLDKIVKERTQKIHDQFDQLLKYAHHNSHEVRAPLSRMQGLMSIIIQEDDIQSKMDLIEKLKASSEELDTVIIEMNQILEAEVLKEKSNLNRIK